MKKIISILILSSLIVYSCDKTKADAPKSSSPTIKKDSTQLVKESSTAGKHISDFVSNQYEIQYEAEGDLNQDGLEDKALVLREKEDTLAQRKTIILLKNPDQTYRLFKSSETVFPEEYNGSGYKMHETEDISINKGTLNINLYDIGPNGNQFSKFKYIDNHLILTYIETYNMGAGSHSALYYEPMKGKITLESINTMEEEMPSTTQKAQVKRERYLFEHVSLDDVVSSAYDSAEKK
ncbi:hypothetical protein CLU97_4405 [Chryseobacterium sp. 7]|uniref:hypothetical protein n=1 Tax=Chryseobacterium sp. 7 TaxID=2035214 RepID=UPI000EAD0621|nr:hypothetical protein [Chryseobacterium sp. 7]RLJ23172.1 hypothetical protein CLU97_4405 [Chryseobacterium sp. 7]